MTIKLVGLYGYDNIGDQILCDTCEYIVKTIIKEKNLKNVNIEKIDMLQQIQYKRYSLKKLLIKIIRKIRFIFFNVLKKENYITDLLSFMEQLIKYHHMFKKSLKKADVIIFVGGAFLKFKSESFQYSIRIIISLADKFKIPVMFNGIGIEGYDKKDIRCEKLKKAINRKCVKVVTTRDDITLLNEKFIESDCTTALVGDSALWLKECYGIKPQVDRKYVGINISYLHLFKAYNLPYNEKAYVEIYRKLISSLQKHDIEFRLYSNGKRQDYEGGLELIKRLGLDESLLLPNANTPLEFIYQVNQFKVIIPLRLHSCITAFALGIPSVGYIWNKKVIKFADIVNMSNNFQPIEELSIELLIDKLININNENIDVTRMEELKVLTKNYLEKFIYGVYIIYNS